MDSPDWPDWPDWTALQRDQSAKSAQTLVKGQVSDLSKKESRPDLTPVPRFSNVLFGPQRAGRPRGRRSGAASRHLAKAGR